MPVKDERDSLNDALKGFEAVTADSQRQFDPDAYEKAAAIAARTKRLR